MRAVVRFAMSAYYFKNIYYYHDNNRQQQTATREEEEASEKTHIISDFGGVANCEKRRNGRARDNRYTLGGNNNQRL